MGLIALMIFTRVFAKNLVLGSSSVVPPVVGGGLFSSPSISSIVGGARARCFS